jgi:predicted membrane-bound spermidine synthase
MRGQVSEQDHSTTHGARHTLALIATASFIVLFQELALIRWLSSQVRAIGYFPNVVLLASFLGLGIGALLASRKSLLPFWPLLVAITTSVAAILGRIIFTQEATTGEHLYLFYLDLPKNAPVVQSIRLPIIAVFIIAALPFIPLGQFVASMLVEAREKASALRGYAADLCGSLAGVIAFAILSFARTTPLVWFGVIFALALPLYRKRTHAIAHVIVAAFVLVLVARSDRAAIYSPYYGIATMQQPEYMAVLANGSRHQIAAPLRYSDKLESPALRQMRDGYHLPYRLLQQPPKSVLILGAGTGNDVAVALDSGAERIDAVEIDPVILELGRRHPSHPYSDPRVHAFNTDARAFLNHTSTKYDLVIFGTLDSMTRLSALSSVRLDNYVYSAGCFTAVKRHLTDRGAVALLFWNGNKPVLDRHISSAIAVGFREQPMVIRQHFGMFDHMYLVGNGYRHLNGSKPVTDEDAKQIATMEDIPTDDWPYLYLEGRTISPFYLSVIAAMLAVSLIAVFGISPAMRGTLRSGGDLEMFLFGAAFMLIETRLVTEMNLVWSATWLTSAVVFGSVLLTIIIATILMELRPVAWNTAAAGLVLAMLATWALPTQLMVGLDIVPRLLASILFVGAPVFFASCCFALMFRSREHPDVAFGWNMLGAVAGGLLEFTSMIAGIKAMALLALAIYLVALLAHSRRVKSAVVAA